MEPVIKSPEQLAKERLTSKVRIQRNIDLIAGLKSGNSSMVAAIEYMKKGFSLADSTGTLLDAWGSNTAFSEKGATMMIIVMCCNKPEANKAFPRNQGHQWAHTCSRYTNLSGYR